MKKYLFVGNLYNEQMLEKLIFNNEKGLQLAADKFQWNILNGFKYNNANIEAVSKIALSSYPFRSKKIFIKKNSYISNSGIHINELPFCNMFIYKNLRAYKIYYNFIAKWIKLNKNKGNELVIIFYSVQPEFLKCIKKIKHLYDNIKVALIVPDLPKYTCLNSADNTLRGKLRNYTDKLFLESTNFIDKYVLLTEYMAKYLNLDQGRYIVVEGMSNFKGYLKHIENNYNEYKTVVYTGSLTKKYGIIKLIEAFNTVVNTNSKLIICGDGEMRDEVVLSTKFNPRIEYLGVLPYSRIVEIQQNATILVNPRENSEEYTKFSFPSKMMEYLASGRPVICYKLDGYPEEYDRHFIYFKDNTLSCMSDTIMYYLNMPEVVLFEIGEKNRKFIDNEKNTNTQAKKIVDFINNVE